jgi:ketosteroid isomerase-like protein
VNDYQEKFLVCEDAEEPLNVDTFCKDLDTEFVTNLADVAKELKEKGASDTVIHIFEHKANQQKGLPLYRKIYDKYFEKYTKLMTEFQPTAPLEDVEDDEDEKAAKKATKDKKAYERNAILVIQLSYDLALFELRNPDFNPRHVDILDQAVDIRAPFHRAEKKFCELHSLDHFDGLKSAEILAKKSLEASKRPPKKRSDQIRS